MTDPHLDDEQLSLLLDGVDVDGRVHLEDGACSTCGSRLAALRETRDAVAAAVVPPLSADLLDQLVATALDAPAVAAVVPLGAAPRRRRLTTPAPAWLVGAAAGIALLVGVAGVFRAFDLSGSADDSSLATVAQDESSEAGSDAAARQLPAAGTAVGATAAADPELVVGDLAEQGDPAALVLALDRLVTPTGRPTSSDFAARESAPTAGGTAAPIASSPADTDQKATAGAAPPATTLPPDRAQCRARADAIGSGRIGELLSTATLRWNGRPAEVLVFRLAEPSTTDSPETRQALVLSRPGCELLADPRF